MFRTRVLSMVVAAMLGLQALMARPAAAQAPTSDVSVEIEQLGVGAVVRPGYLTPLRVRLTNNPSGGLDEAALVWVQWDVPNADGDEVGYSRAVTLTKGRPTSLWLYAPLPPVRSRDTVWPVNVFELRDGRRRGEVGGKRFRIIDTSTPTQVESITTGLIGVIGQRQMGLTGYSVIDEQIERSPAGHEKTRVVFGLRPEEMPDRWYGLLGFEAIAWSNASPQELSTDTASALREYVRRGGHLIITLPEDFNPWQFGSAGQTALDDLLPRREPRKDEGVPLADLVPVLSKAQSSPADFSMAIRVFKDLNGSFDAIDPPYEPLIAMPDGRVVVIRRTFGHGHVTIVGIDLTQQRLYQVPLSDDIRGLPQADAFWNRVLGRRVDTPSAAEFQAMRRESMLAGGRDSARDVNGGLFTQHISMSSQAGIGLLLAIVLFAAYWILAGPGGFALLRLYGQTKHAWLAFAGMAIVFTAVAWGSVGLIRLNEPRVLHVTYLDHIARPSAVTRPEDPQYQRAVSWFSLYTPGYGRLPISIDSIPGQRDLIVSWDPPGEIVQRFPNADRYTIDVGESANAYDITSRSTATLLHADWLGGVDADWGSLIQVDPDDPISVEGSGGRAEQALRGSIRHNLPGELRDVTIIWVRNARMPRQMYARSGDMEYPWVTQVTSGSMPNLGYIFRQTSWEPGRRLDLSTLPFDGSALLARGIERRYVEPYRASLMSAGGTSSLSPSDRRSFMEFLSFFHQLTPPTYLRSRPDDPVEPNNAVFQRLLGRELDLSPWFTRPCLIVIGFLEDSPTPLPLRIDTGGTKPESSGLTIVRWIYPLPLDENVAFGRSAQRPSADGEIEAP